MIPLEIKQESSKLSLSTNTQNSDELEASLSFKELLQGVKEASLEKKEIQNGAFILALEDESVESKSEQKNTKTALEFLLNSDESDIATDVLSKSDTLVFNTKLTTALSGAELKQLISDAKNYLKEQIQSTEGFLRSEASALPKTLKGLTQFAQKLGIDLSNITVEEVKNSANEKLNLSLQETEKKSMVSDLSAAKTKKKPLQENKMQQFQENMSEEIVQENKTQAQKKEIAGNLQKEPLFQAQSKREVSTQELVGVKLQNQQASSTQKKKEKADDETLKLLLQGKNAVKGNDKIFLTQDFSTATARVIAPQALRESDKSLESLLQGDTTQSETQELVKNDTTVKTLKADSFEVKLNEAKQMTKYLSQDVKNAIDNYKAPFTRLKVQLNPQNLGEIELTIVQRGKNLHVNLSSNNAAINALAMNANDLKVQLQNSGINNASLNFSNNSQSGDQAASQQQQQQQSREQSQAQYRYFDDEVANEELVSSLEIVVLNYA